MPTVTAVPGLEQLQHARVQIETRLHQIEVVAAEITSRLIAARVKHESISALRFGAIPDLFDARHFRVAVDCGNTQWLASDIFEQVVTWSDLQPDDHGYRHGPIHLTFVVDDQSVVAVAYWGMSNPRVKEVTIFRSS